MLKNIISTFQLILILSFFIACKKSEHKSSLTFINSIVVDYKTKQAVPGIKLYLIRQGYRLDYYSEYWEIQNADTVLQYTPTYTVIDSTISDANGRFKLSYTPIFDSLENFNWEPSIIIIDNSFLRVQPRFFTSHSLNDTILVDKKAFFKLNIQKMLPASINDTIFQSIQYLSEPFSYQFPGWTMLRGQVGKTNYSFTDEIPYSIFKKAIVEWRHYNMGIQNAHIDTVTMSPAGNTIFNITY